MLQVTGYGAGNLSHMGVHLLGAMGVLAGGEDPAGPRVSWVVGGRRATPARRGGRPAGQRLPGL